MSKETSHSLLQTAYEAYFMNNFRSRVVPQMDDKIKTLLKYIRGKGTVLDVGCLTGYLCHFASEMSVKAVGIDFIAGAVDIAKGNGVDARVCDLEHDELPLKAHERFDVIVVSEVIEHLIDPIPLLKKLRPHLEENGLLVLSTPNMAYIQYRVELLLGLLPDFGEFRKKYPERPYNFQHKTLFTFSVLQETLMEAGFTINAWDSHSHYKNKMERALWPLERLFPRLFVKNMMAIARCRE